MVRTASGKAERVKAIAAASVKSSKQKAKNASKPKTKSPNKSESDPLPAIAGKKDPDSMIEAAEKITSKDKKHRFIVFIGNLPYTATTTQISHHFASVGPSQIRHSTDRTTGKSKGFAFLEFDEYSRMETCIKLFHHSLFGGVSSSMDDPGEEENAGRRRNHGEEKGENGRRINVELTAGGGGSKSAARKSKIRAKNEKLGEERKRRAAAAVAAATASYKVSGKAKTQQKQDIQTEEENHVHPSRRLNVAK